MAEYIEREKYVKLNDIIETLEYEWGYEGMREDLYNLPAADVVEVRHGEWLLEQEPDGKPYCFHCSVCDNDFHYIGIKTAFDYCPNCGAKMDGKEQTE